MSIEPLAMLMPKGNLLKPAAADTASASDFSSALLTALRDVNRLQVRADESAQNLVSGEINDIHQVMLDTEKANLSLQLTVQIRNKLVEAYQEISRLQF